MKLGCMKKKIKTIVVYLMLMSFTLTGCTTTTDKDTKAQITDSVKITESIATIEPAIQDEVKFDLSALEGKKLIAITVDDGPDGSGTQAYLKIANDYDIPLTFFVIGKNISRNSSQLQLMLEAGCEIGNHSYSHDYLSGLEADAIMKEINDTNNLISQYAPDAIVSFVRAPYFSYSDTLSASVGFPFIDAQLQETSNAQETLNVLKGATDGDIVLLHSSNADSREALVEAIPYLQEQGFVFVTVAQLFQAHGVEALNGTIYKHVGVNTLNKYTSNESLFLGEGFAVGDWNAWSAAVELNASVIASMTEDMAISVEYEATAGPCFILMDTNDGGPSWVQLTPSFDDGRIALFTYYDLFSHYDFGENLATVDAAQIRPWGADITVREVKLLTK